MNNLNKVLVLFVLLTLSPVEDSYAQLGAGAESNGYNPLSLRQVHESYLMWKKTLWRRVDLKEKQNKPFFARNREMSKIIIEAVERGVLIPYDSDSVNDSNVMSREIFIENIQSDPDSTGTGFNSSDYGYKFFKVTDFDTTGLLARIRVDASALTDGVGTPKEIQDYVPLVTNKKTYPTFDITKEKLLFAKGEKLQTQGELINLEIADSNTSFIKVFGSYTLSVNETIVGKQSGNDLKRSQFDQNKRLKFHFVSIFF